MPNADRPCPISESCLAVNIKIRKRFTLRILPGKPFDLKTLLSIMRAP
jgi:hypothetical protein